MLSLLVRVLPPASLVICFKFVDRALDLLGAMRCLYSLLFISDLVLLCSRRAVPDALEECSVLIDDASMP